MVSSHASLLPPLVLCRAIAHWDAVAVSPPRVAVCRRHVLLCVATSVRHRCAPLLCATAARHRCAPPLCATSARHRCAPPLRAAFGCRCLRGCRTSGLNHQKCRAPPMTPTVSLDLVVSLLRQPQAIHIYMYMISRSIFKNTRNRWSQANTFVVTVAAKL